MARHFTAFVEKSHDATIHVAESSNQVSSVANRPHHANEQMTAGMEEAAKQAKTKKALSSIEEGVNDIGVSTTEAGKSRKALKEILL